MSILFMRSIAIHVEAQTASMGEILQLDVVVHEGNVKDVAAEVISSVFPQWQEEKVVIEVSVIVLKIHSYRRITVWLYMYVTCM